MLENSEKLLILISKVLEVSKSEINDNTACLNDYFFFIFLRLYK